MQVDEKIIVTIPKSIKEASKHKRGTWLRRAVKAAMWDLRMKVLKEKGEDIFSLFVMTDCFEISLKGEIDSLPVERRQLYHTWLKE